MRLKQIIILLTILSVFTIIAQACEGDCVMCHPTLIKENGKMDADHAILVSCKTCHTQEEMEKIDMGSGCGQDCWDCHDIKKVTASNVAEHRGLQKCIDCHLSINKTLLGGAVTSAFSDLPTLNDLMSQEVTIESSIDATEELNEANKVVEKEEKTEIKKEKVEVSEATIQTSQKTEEMSTFDKIINFFKGLWLKIMSIFS